jgi:hypothetical protein
MPENSAALIQLFSQVLLVEQYSTFSHDNRKVVHYMITENKQST